MKYFLWNMSGNCNLGCCYCWSTAAEEGDELAAPAKLELVEWLKSLGCETLVLTGGEPLLADGFRAVLQRCAHVGISCRILTNGTLLDQSLACDLVRLGVEEVHVSLDSPNPDESDDYRSRGSEAAQAVSLLTRVGCGRTRVVVSAVAMTRRLHQLEALLAGASDGGYMVQYQMCCVGPRHPLWAEDPRSLGLLERQRWLEQLQAAHVRYGRYMLPSARAYFQHARRWLLTGRPPANRCPAGRDAMVVRTNGRLTPCFFREEEPDDAGQCFDLPCVLFFRSTL